MSHPVRNLSLLSLLIFQISLAGMEIIASPDETIQVFCSIQEHAFPYEKGERFYFKVQYQDQTVIANSPIGVAIHNEPPLDTGFRIYNVQHTILRDSVAIDTSGPRFPWNIHQCKFSLQEKRPPFRFWEIVFRVADEGVAYQLIIPHQSEIASLAITRELTEFWIHDPSSLPGHSSVRVDSLAFSELPGDVSFHFPVKVHTGAFSLIFTETVAASYPAMILTNKRNGLPIFTFKPAENASMADAATSPSPIKSPWRIIFISKDPIDIKTSRFRESLDESPVESPDQH